MPMCKMHIRTHGDRYLAIPGKAVNPACVHFETLEHSKFCLSLEDACFVASAWRGVDEVTSALRADSDGSCIGAEYGSIDQLANI